MLGWSCWLSERELSDGGRGIKGLKRVDWGIRSSGRLASLCWLGREGEGEGERSREGRSACSSQRGAAFAAQLAKSHLRLFCTAQGPQTPWEYSAISHHTNKLARELEPLRGTHLRATLKPTCCLRRTPNSL